MFPTVSRVRPLLAAVTAALLGLPAAAQAAEPGDLITAAPYHADWVPSKAAQAYLLNYRTPDHRGQLAQGTGLLYLPAGTVPAGGWPVVSWAHGTQGIADHCAPSRSGPTHAERDGRFLDAFLAQGYAVVAADYQGLGSPSDHAYLHVRTAARNSIDMIKASQRFLGGRLSPRWVSVGYSQGGAAALSAGHQAATYSGSGLQYKGSFTAGTPTAVEITALVMRPDSRTANPGALNAYHAYLLDGLLKVAPQIDRVLSPQGRARIALARQHCLTDLATQLEGASTGEMFSAPLTSVPGIWALLHDYLGVPRQGFTQPLMLAHGTRDQDVPYLTTLLYAAGLVLRGEPVAFRQYPVDHRGTLDAATADGVAFAKARLADARFDEAGETTGLEKLLDAAQ